VMCTISISIMLIIITIIYVDAISSNAITCLYCCITTMISAMIS